jgi:AbrB family looped-hinge helix DNA binding protein
MVSATVTSKGQVTIPIEVRRDMDITAGSRLDFIPNGDGSYRVISKRRSIMDLAGCLSYDGPPVPVEEMDRGIATAAVEDHRWIFGEHA